MTSPWHLSNFTMIIKLHVMMWSKPHMHNIATPRSKIKVDWNWFSVYMTKGGIMLTAQLACTRILSGFAQRTHACTCFQYTMVQLFHSQRCVWVKTMSMLGPCILMHATKLPEAPCLCLPRLQNQVNMDCYPSVSMSWRNFTSLNCSIVLVLDTRKQTINCEK